MGNSLSNLNLNISSIGIIKKFWKKIKNKRKSQIKILFLLMLLGGLAEMITIGSLFPFLSVLMNKEILLKNNFVRNGFGLLGITNTDNLLLATTLIFLIAVFLSISLRVLNIWISGRLCAAIGSDLSQEAFGRTINQQYHVHINRNSSDLIAAISIQMNLTIQALDSVLYMLSASGITVSATMAFLGKAAVAVAGAVSATVLAVIALIGIIALATYRVYEYTEGFKEWDRVMDNIQWKIDAVKDGIQSITDAADDFSDAVKKITLGGIREKISDEIAGMGGSVL